MTWMGWYGSLAKPSWTPAPSTISLIWTILYPIILVSFGFVFVQAFRGRVGWKVALPFAINLVANLLTNAAKYTERRDHFWLTAERQSSEVVVSVQDTDIGIAAEHLPRLFEMFSQAESALERS
jgi:signal transduction histidine kinase